MFLAAQGLRLRPLFSFDERRGTKRPASNSSSIKGQPNRAVTPNKPSTPPLPIPQCLSPSPLPPLSSPSALWSLWQRPRCAPTSATAPSANPQAPDLSPLQILASSNQNRSSISTLTSSRRLSSLGPWRSSSTRFAIGGSESGQFPLGVVCLCVADGGSRKRPVVLGWACAVGRVCVRFGAVAR